MTKEPDSKNNVDKQHKKQYLSHLILVLVQC